MVDEAGLTIRLTGQYAVNFFLILGYMFMLATSPISDALSIVCIFQQKSKLHVGFELTKRHEYFSKLALLNYRRFFPNPFCLTRYNSVKRY